MGESQPRNHSGCVVSILTIHYTTGAPPQDSFLMLLFDLPFSVTAFLLPLAPLPLPPLPLLVLLGHSSPWAFSDAVKPGQAAEDCCGDVYSSQGGRRVRAGGDEEGGGRSTEWAHGYWALVVLVIYSPRCT